MRRGFGGMHRKDLMVKIRQAKLRRAHLRQAIAQSSRELNPGAMLREKRLLRAQQAIAARKEQLHQAIKNASETEERITKRAQGKEGRSAAARREGGEFRGKGLERAQKAVEAHKERLDRMLRNQKEIEDTLRQRLQDSGTQVLSLYDPTEITVEQEELEAEEEEEDDNGSSGSSGGGYHAAKSGKRAAKKGRKGHA